MSSKFTMFSDMKWLDKKIERNANSIGRNECSDYYYDILLQIKKAQEDGTITDKLYTKLNSWFGYVSPENGYYTANIHYDLFEYFDKQEELEKRFLYFLNTSDINILKNESWFIYTIYDLTCFMRQIYNVDYRIDEESFFSIYGNEIEKEIFNRYKQIISMKK